MRTNSPFNVLSPSIYRGRPRVKALLQSFPCNVREYPQIFGGTAVLLHRGGPHRTAKTLPLRAGHGRGDPSCGPALAGPLYGRRECS